MNKGELVDRVAGKVNLSKRQTEQILTAMLEAIVETVASGEKVALAGFGTFEQRHRQARVGRNPKTGEELHIAASRVPGFSPGKAFKEAV
jgi:DNA-binding protein HU-beta